MIASMDNRSGSMVTLYRTKRGYLGANVEPVDFCSMGPGSSADDSLRALGYQREGEWTPTPDRPGEFYAPVSREGN